MGKKKKNISETLPTRSETHIKEDKSLLLFKDFVAPWVVYDIKGNDYGIDASVEITKDKVKSQDKLVTGKRFHVQLKSTSVKNGEDFNVSIKKTTFLYWYQFTTPVLIFLVDVKTGNIFYKKIENGLLSDLSKSNPNWHAQDTVGIKFTAKDLIGPKTLFQIQSYVYKWTYKPTKIITPGEYYDNINQAIDFVKEFKECVSKHNFNEFNTQIDDNLTEIGDSIFNICIIGPSRMGKSMLINALMRREMSPVDVLPTTGVPIVMLPGYPEEVTVHFEGKSKITKPIDLSFISEYADQKNNKMNHKKVTMVDVKLASDFLEKGFSITDVPGIDDINPVIKKIAKSTIYSANVIIYVISVSAHKDGEFKITDRHLEDLMEIREKMSRIFLVFNKIDSLNKTQLQSLQVYINDTLRDYGIEDMLAHEPIYISAKQSFEKRVLNKRYKDTVQELEEKIVKYLINGNLNGINNLLSNFAGSMTLMSQIINICDARLTDTERSGEILQKIEIVRSELKELQEFIRNQRNTAYNEIQEYISVNFETIVSNLESDLRKKTAHEDLPSQSQVTYYFQSQMDESVSRVYEYTQQVIYALQSEVNMWVSDKLKQVQINLDEINAETSFSLHETEKFRVRVQNIYNVKEQLSSNVIITAFNFIEKAFGSFFSLIGAAFKSHDRLKRERITELIRPARAQFKKLESEFLTSSSEHLTKVCRSIENKTIERSKIYLDTLASELEKVGKPLKAVEKENIMGLKKCLGDLEIKGSRRMLEIRDYANGVL